MEISIHALAKRATFYQCFFFATARISIHALAKRATKASPCLLIGIGISIHALAKRATNLALNVFSWIGISIHALAKRATLKFTPIHFSFSFQSTPSQRGRQHFTPLPRPRWKFQSTPSQRGRPCGHRRTALVRSISIHALVKRATDEVGAMDSYPIISIHALVKRATRRRYRAHTHRRISIHALVKRATFLILSLVLRHSNFNPRPREEGDVVTDTWSILSGSFQSTPS